MTINDLLEKYDDWEGVTIIKTDMNVLVAEKPTYLIAENKFLCAEEIKCFDFKDGALHITIYDENKNECDNCNRPCCYGCPYAEK